MSQAASRTPVLGSMTVEQWAALPEDEPGELLGGYLVEEEMPDSVHELLVALLIRIFGNWVFPRGGIVLGSDARFALAPGRGRKPDLSVYLPGRPMPPRRGAVSIAPDIAIEVVSPTPRDGRRDRVEKVEEYAAFGVAFYWIVDPELRAIEILELTEVGRYVRAPGLVTGTIQEVPGCPGLELDVDALWAAIDRLPPANDAP